MYKKEKDCFLLVAIKIFSLRINILYCKAYFLDYVTLIQANFFIVNIISYSIYRGYYIWIVGIVLYFVVDVDVVMNVIITKVLAVNITVNAIITKVLAVNTTMNVIIIMITVLIVDAIVTVIAIIVTLLNTKCNSIRMGWSKNGLCHSY